MKACFGAAKEGEHKIDKTFSAGLSGCFSFFTLMFQLGAPNIKQSMFLWRNWNQVQMKL
jgi:hypothetical protein